LMPLLEPNPNIILTTKNPIKIAESISIFPNLFYIFLSNLWHHPGASLSFPRSVSLSFPRRWESRINISWIPFFKGMTRHRESFPLFFVIPTKVGIQSHHSLDPLLQGDDKRQICHSHEGGNPVSPFPGSPLSRG
ncbi:MAG: hypothetical protein SFT68_00880, partial [Rickettsiaceae bacterium]|nr:hypothetical protein [Rickettsiaceae bacterium]